MSKMSRILGMLAVAILLGGGMLAAAQVNTIKDAWLVMKVHSEMLDEDVLSGSDIDVDVEKAIVTLQGTVPSEAARARALAVAKASDGVKGVVDQLKIAPATIATSTGVAEKTAEAARKVGRAIDDGWITSKIYAQYLAEWDTVLNDSDIDVEVDDKIVTLSGTVKTADAKTKAVSIAKATDGVKEVRDNLKVGATTR